MFWSRPVEFMNHPCLMAARSVVVAALMVLVACSSEPSDVVDDAASDLVAEDSAEDSAPLDIGVIEDVWRPDVDGCGELGCACATDEDCDAGPCVVALGGDRYCADRCERTCNDANFRCRDVERDGGVESLCVPSAELCQACEDDAACGPLATECVTLTDGAFCAQVCGRNDLCPVGTACEDRDGVRVCVPPSGVCQACIDSDDDDYGIGLSCAGIDCDEADPDVFEGAPELCNETDDDCDGEVDEDFDFAGDAAHCGGCFQACSGRYSTQSCVDGACVVDACEGSWRDCNDDPSDGCETDVDATGFCGVCTPPGQTPGQPCGTCGSGRWVCDGAGGVVCEGDAGDEALNACGGCSTLPNVPGAACGPCGLDGLACVDEDTLACDGTTLGNACGGCNVLAYEPGDACGTCSRGTYACDGTTAVECEGDPGPSARNACGGCGTLLAVPGVACESCPALSTVCATPNEVLCEPHTCCPGEVRDVACSRCGVAVETCVADGSGWEVGACDEPACCPGDEQTEACGACGERTRVCGGDGEWGEWSTCAQPECCAEDVDVRTCSGCGSQSRGCVDGAWGDWSVCEAPACCPGTTEEQACGACGTSQRGCIGGEWSEWSECEEPLCCVGSEQVQMCNDCGAQVRVCLTGSTWSSWGTCDVPTGGGTCPAGETCRVGGYCE